MPIILLVEDNEVALRATTQILEKGGYTVIKAMDGREGLEKLYKENVDIVVADILLPHYNGLEMLGKIRNGHFKRDIGVILITALAEESAKISAFNLGADDFLQKPFSVAELISRVESLLAKKAVRN
jgi:DNA-binding response OmpR family regulator